MLVAVSKVTSTGVPSVTAVATIAASTAAVAAAGCSAFVADPLPALPSHVAILAAVTALTVELFAFQADSLQLHWPLPPASHEVLKRLITSIRNSSSGPVEYGSVAFNYRKLFFVVSGKCLKSARHTVSSVTSTWTTVRNSVARVSIRP